MFLYILDDNKPLDSLGSIWEAQVYFMIYLLAYIPRVLIVYKGEILLYKAWLKCLGFYCKLSSVESVCENLTLRRRVLG